MEHEGVLARMRRGSRQRAMWTMGVAAAGLMLAGMAPIGATSAATRAPISFAITAPRAGSTVDSPVKLQIAVRGTQIGRPVTGLDHLHVRVDGGEVQAVYKNRTLSVPLAPGKHTIAVELAGPTHEPVLPWQSVSFTVR